MTYTGYSDDESTLFPYDETDSDEEIDDLHRVVRNESRDKAITIIAVVPNQSVDDMNARTKKRWWQFRKGNHRVFVTTPQKLQYTIKSHGYSEKRDKLAIIAHAAVESIAFSVHSPIRTLKILYCGDEEEDSPGGLIVRGFSKFSGIRVDEWMARTNKQRKKIYLGEGVHVKLEAGIRSSFSSTSSFCDEKGRGVADYLDQIRSSGMKGEWWNKWKGPTAAILGILVTGTKLAFGLKASAAGIFFNLQLPMASVTVGGFKASAAAIATAAGPAVLLGAATALAVYVVPWDDVFDWIQGKLIQFGGWLMTMWYRFKSWLAAAFEPKFKRQRPMFS